MRSIPGTLATAAAASVLASAAQSGPAPTGSILVRQTEGTARFAAAPSLSWRPVPAAPEGAIQLDASHTYQEILGFGAAFTDASCYLIHQLPPEAREKLLHELFHPSEMGFLVGRVPLGASDYSTSLYSFDEGDPDPDLLHFSIDHDRAYMLPVLAQARQMAPELFLFGSAWSPPGWMKANASMLGGSMRKKYFGAYAQYLLRSLEGYAEAGVPLQALTVQNEVDTDQDGRMPACLWGQEYEMQFVAKHLGPALAASRNPAKIWILDHNYNLWGRVLDELEDPEVARYVDGVAWHGYFGSPGAMTRVHDAYPAKHMYWTEGGPDYKSPDYLTDWAKWGAMYAGVLRNYARCIVGWNLALDEKGCPNIGPFSCGGLVQIHSGTQEITRSGQYWAFAHYARAMRRGARRIASTGKADGVSHVAVINPDGSKAAVLTNSGAVRSVRLWMGGSQAEATLPAGSISTLTWK